MDKEQILYEDKDIIVCHKPAGIATQTAKIGQRDMVSEVANYLAAASVAGSKPNKLPYVGLIHRLDQPVEGVLVFAKNQKAAAGLSRQISSNQTEKYYYALVSLTDSTGLSKEDAKERIVKKAAEDYRDEVTIINYLYKDNKSNTSSIVNKEHTSAKRAELNYKILKQVSVIDFYKRYKGYDDSLTDAEDIVETPSLRDFKSMYIALLRIKLITGRHHQIRVQFSHAGMSLLGDYKYADDKTRKLSELINQKQVALCAYELKFNQPITGKRMSFHKKPEAKIFQSFL